MGCGSAIPERFDDLIALDHRIAIALLRHGMTLRATSTQRGSLRSYASGEGHLADMRTGFHTCARWDTDQLPSTVE